MDAEVEGEDEINTSERPRVAERARKHVPPKVEPQNLDFDVNEFLRSSPNPVVASVFGDCEIIRMAAVRRGYPVMRSRFLNFVDDIHDQSVRERISGAIQLIPPRLLILVFTSRVWSPILNYATSLLEGSERIDRERATEMAILEWVVSLVRNSGSNWEHVSHGKILWASRAGIKSQSKDLGTPPSRLKEFSFLCMFGGNDPRSRGALKRSVRNCQRTHKRISEFVSLAHASRKA